MVADVTGNAQNGDTVELEITDPGGGDVVVGGGTVSPTTPITLDGSTTLAGAELTLTHYHWRADDGTESGASSATNGNEDTPLTGHARSSPIRLRLGISNEGSAVADETRFRVEFGAKVTTCANVSLWTDVDEVTDDDWDMYDSVNLTDETDTTNIAVSSGGVSDENTTFLTPNGGVQDVGSRSASTTLDTDEHVDLEFSLTSTANTQLGTDYCFRVSADGVDLPTYDTYAEIETAPQQDILVQRGTTVISGTSTVLTAGSNYTAPDATSSAFIRITNAHHTGAGNTSGGGIQDPDEVTAYVEDASDITQSVTLARFVDNGAETHVDWEIVEFIGSAGTDNEFIVRDVDTRTLTSSDLSATGTTLANVSDDSDVVVFITGVRNRNTTRNYYAGQVTSNWDAGASAPTLRRESTGAATIDVSYAVVEYTGLNWKIQRVEHEYTAAGTAQTAAISPVGSLSRAFLHTQKRMGDLSNQVVHVGQTAWLSSMGAVSFRLESNAHLDDQFGVAWVIENTATGDGAMFVQRTNGTTNGGSEPLDLSISVTTPVSAADNASVFINTSAAGSNLDHPRTYAGAKLTSTSSYRIFRSDTGSTLTYRTEVVDWPVAKLAQRQNYYRFYVPNNQLLPSDPWPLGVSALGENTSITDTDDPPGFGDRLRLRMSVRVSNANMPVGFQQYKLQYAERVSTCSAVGSWTDVGGVSSGTIWRGYAATGTSDGTVLSGNPPTAGDLVLSVSDEAGTLEHDSPSVANPYSVLAGDDLELDWHLEHNGAADDTVYCFRLVASDGTPLDGYLNYPQLRTADFSPETVSWRWYGDPENETPTNPLAASNTAPSNVANEETLALRVAVTEAKSVTGSDVRFTLQFSEDVNFANAQDVVATSTCTGNALWCYTPGGASDNATVTTALLDASDSCSGGSGSGCGRHVSSPSDRIGHVHPADATQEYSFTLQHAGARVNANYYFRLVEVASGDPVPLAANASAPALVTEGAQLTFSVLGLDSGTSTAGVTLNATTSPTSIGFGSLEAGVDHIAAHRISVDTNATEGYQVLGYSSQPLLNSYGDEILAITASNTNPQSWAAVCTAGTESCFGYHSTDATLAGGSTRFAADDTYAALDTEPAELMYSSLPVDDTHDIVYRVRVDATQPAGDYETDIVYLAVPVY